MKLRILAATLAIGITGCANLSTASAQSDAAVVTIADGYVVVSQDPVFARATKGADAAGATVRWKIGTPGATFTKDGIVVDARVKTLPKPMAEADARRPSAKLNDVESAKRVKCEPSKDRTVFTCQFPKGIASGLYAYTIRVSYKGMVYEHDPIIVSGDD